MTGLPAGPIYHVISLWSGGRIKEGGRGKEETGEGAHWFWPLLVTLCMAAKSRECAQSLCSLWLSVVFRQEPTWSQGPRENSVICSLCRVWNSAHS